MISQNIDRLKQFLADKLGVQNTDNLQQFLGGVFWSTLGVFLSSGIMFIASALAGRIIGPSEYGKYALITSISAILSTFMSFGFSVAVIKYGSETNNKKQQGAIFTYSLIGLALMFVATTPIVYFGRSLIAHFLNSDINLIFYAWLISVIFMIRTLFESFLIAQKRFKLMSILKAVESVIVLTSFLLLIHIFPKSYLVYFWPLCIGGLLAISTYCIIFAKSLQPLSNLKIFRKIFQYQTVNIGLMLIGVILNNIDKLFINRYLNSEALGIYSAYLAASLLIFSQVAMALYNVLFSSMTKIEDKASIVRTIDRFFIKYAIVFIPVIATITFGVLHVFGHKYGINLNLILLFSIYAYLFVWASCFSGIVGSSKALLTFGVRFTIFKPFILVGLYYLLLVLHQISISNIVFIMILSYLYDISLIHISLRFYKKKEI